MAGIQVGIEGEGAPAAAEALLEIPGISGSYEVPIQRERTLVAIATIIGIVGGVAALAEQVRKWYQEWHKSHPGKQFDVVILDPETGNRILLEEVKARDAINRRLYKGMIIVETAIYRVFVIMGFIASLLPFSNEIIRIYIERCLTTSSFASTQFVMLYFINQF